MVAHRNYNLADLMDMPLYQRHKILYNFMQEKEREKKAMDEARNNRK